MTDYNMVALGRHRKTVPSGKLPHHDCELSPVFNTDPAQSRIVAKFARRYGLSVVMARTVTELADFQMDVRS